MRKLVTCPELGHLEEIDVAEDPVDGHLLGISRCSRFQPGDGVPCDMLCMHRLNARLDNLIGARDTRPPRVGRPNLLGRRDRER